MSWFKHKAGESTGVLVDRLPAGASLSCARSTVRTANVYFHNGYYYTKELGGIVMEAHAADVVEPLVPAPTPGYADGNPKSLQGAKKFSLRYLPLSANIEVNRALEDGAAKYGAANWREKGVATSVYIDACKRHLELYFDCSQQNATDSNVHNLGHAMACLAIIIDAEKAGSLIDDRPFPFPDGDALLLRPVK